jgi:hypothetical protein
MRLVVVAISFATVGSCNDPAEPTPEFPASYASTFEEVRDCRASGDHDLHHIRILADPSAIDAYTMRDRAFPAGAIVLKEEYDGADDTCGGPIVQWTVMVRLADSSPATLDWHWQKVDPDRKVLTEDEPRCIGCHQSCGTPPDGYLGTCAVP